MVKIKKASNLGVTFSKRRVGLFKKASELCTLCGAKIVIVIFSLDGKNVFSFGDPSVDRLVERFLGRNLPPANNDVHNQQIVACREAGIRERNTKLMNLKGVLQMEKNCGESLREIRKRADGV
ncbi:agamous-like MADS-box protein AGL62 [Solanum tuberosum]|uniref:Mads box protein n=1 Tax=Solanum tuberosum TaxID=4113 RepID=M1DWT9_SOLTU|nr:PREDICTED: agamous-like MADS-box protein AGL62 [Solanum tuberosum]